MSILKIAIFAGAILMASIALFLVYAATRPAQFEYARSMVIDAAPEEIFPHISHLPSFDEWNPFASDARMQLSYSDPAEGRGAKSSFTGDGSVGTLEITRVERPSRIEMQLVMVKPFPADNLVVFTLTPEANGTRVAWTMSGRNGFVAKAMNTIFNGEKFCTDAFEKGLGDLKVRVEGDRKPALNVA